MLFSARIPIIKYSIWRVKAKRLLGNRPFFGGWMVWWVQFRQPLEGEKKEKKRKFSKNYMQHVRGAQILKWVFRAFERSEPHQSFSSSLISERAPYPLLMRVWWGPYILLTYVHLVKTLYHMALVLLLLLLFKDLIFLFFSFLLSFSFWLFSSISSLLGPWRWCPVVFLSIGVLLIINITPHPIHVF